MKITGKMSLSSRLWLDRQMKDPYVKRAHAEGYRCRAVFKLMEIDEKFHIIKNAERIVDLGAAPGGWSQLLSERTRPSAEIVAIDLLQFDPIDKVKQFVGDFENADNQNAIISSLGGKADLIVSDMAPSTLGQQQTDHLRIMRLAQSAYEFVKKVMRPGGTFVIKIFQGGKEKQFVEELRQHFEKVQFFKPKASRTLSVEIYIVAIGFKSCN